MSKVALIKFIGTLASFAAGGGAVFAPEPYRQGITAIAGARLGWLHLPQPGAAVAK